eukprot:1792757-Rhodomonas_salina.1
MTVVGQSGSETTRTVSVLGVWLGVFARTWAGLGKTVLCMLSWRVVLLLVFSNRTERLCPFCSSLDKRWCEAGVARPQ